jgi:hypothetical protein
VYHGLGKTKKFEAAAAKRKTLNKSENGQGFRSRIFVLTPILRPKTHTQLMMKQLFVALLHTLILL